MADHGLTYDTGALLAAEANREAVWALHRWALARAVEPVVPSVVLAQAWRGGPQPAMSRLLRGCDVDGFDESAARSVGRTCALSRCPDIVDVAVVVGAAARGDLVVTSDPGDLTRIADALNLKVPVHAVLP